MKREHDANRALALAALPAPSYFKHTERHERHATNARKAAARLASFEPAGGDPYNRPAKL
jgi:hypothetical protein